jgi:hypothetical protein
MDIKYTIIFHCKTLQNLPNWDFGFENKPSGIPVDDRLKNIAHFADLKNEILPHLIRDK